MSERKSIESMRLFKPRVAMVLGWTTLASLVVLGLFGLWGAPPDRVQGDAQRLMYLHVPTAWVAYLAFGVTALGSALWLWPRTRSDVWDRVAGSSAGAPHNPKRVSTINEARASHPSALLTCGLSSLMLEFMLPPGVARRRASRSR